MSLIGFMKDVRKASCANYMILVILGESISLESHF